MKIKKVGELNEGLRVNPKIIMLRGEYDLDEVLNELQSLYDEENEIGIPGTLFTLDIESELFFLMRDLRNWRKDGWKGIRGYGLEWIPLSESPKK